MDDYLIKKLFPFILYLSEKKKNIICLVLWANSLFQGKWEASKKKNRWKAVRGAIKRILEIFKKI